MQRRGAKGLGWPSPRASGIDHLKMRTLHFLSFGKELRGAWISWLGLHSFLSPPVRVPDLGLEECDKLWAHVHRGLCTCVWVADGEAPCFSPLWPGHLKLQVSALGSSHYPFTKIWRAFMTFIHPYNGDDTHWLTASQGCCEVSGS